jgi:hypothetical protein
MNHTFTDKYLSKAIMESTMRRARMIGEANGETLESEAEDALRAFQTDLKKQIKVLVPGEKITVALRDVFLAGYRAAEERRFR